MSHSDPQLSMTELAFLWRRTKTINMARSHFDPQFPMTELAFLWHCTQSNLRGPEVFWPSVTEGRACFSVTLYAKHSSWHWAILTLSYQWQSLLFCDNVCKAILMALRHFDPQLTVTELAFLWQRTQSNLCGAEAFWPLVTNDRAGYSATAYAKQSSWHWSILTRRPQRETSVSGEIGNDQWCEAKKERETNSRCGVWCG